MLARSGIIPGSLTVGIKQLGEKACFIQIYGSEKPNLQTKTTNLMNDKLFGIGSNCFGIGSKNGLLQNIILKQSII
jgi:hypothetical protein